MTDPVAMDDHPIIKGTPSGELVKLSDFFIDRPIFAAVLSAFITIGGAIALFKLPISEYPEVVPLFGSPFAALPWRESERLWRTPSRRPTRAADRRCRGHDVHVFDLHDGRLAHI